MPLNERKSQSAEPECRHVELAKLRGRRLSVVFDEPDTSTEGGAVLLREVESRCGIIEAVAGSIADKRSGLNIIHDMQSLVAQRVMQICQGWEDANDCDSLRNDPMIKIAAGHDPQGNPLGSQATMTRLENSVSRKDLVRIGKSMLAHFVDSFEQVPEAMVIDMDPSPCRTYGDQQLTLFNAHYDTHCLMPFHVYEGLTGKLITTVVRPGKTPTAGEIIALLERIVMHIRERFPKTMLIFRADSHHTKPEVLDWLESAGVHYILGLAVNNVLRRETAAMVEGARGLHREAWRPYRRFHSFSYAAGTWSRKRRVVARIEATVHGTDVRYIVTSLVNARASFLYDDVYCGRGNAELMIKEHKCGLKSERTSCNRWEANQFRMFLHSVAYTLMHTLKNTLLKGTELASAGFETIRLKLLKAASRVECGKTFIRIHLPSAFPARHTLLAALRANIAPDSS